VKEAEVEEREMEYIRQVDAKEINKEKFQELVNELYLERAMGESIAEGLATMQDEDIGESEQEELAEEEPAVAAVAVVRATLLT
jgi:hypothetical protein